MRTESEVRDRIAQMEAAVAERLASNPDGISQLLHDINLLKWVLEQPSVSAMQARIEASERTMAKALTTLRSIPAHPEIEFEAQEGDPMTDAEPTGTVCRECHRAIMVSKGGDVFCPNCGYFPEVEDATEIDPEACPGCKCMPGDGLTEGCYHPDGCGFYRALAK